MISKRYFTSLWYESWELNKNNILEVLEPSGDARLLDIGCNDGSWTVQVASRVGTSHTYGLDITPTALEMAKDKGVNVLMADLEARLPFASRSFDVVHANQVIEHLVDVDKFVEEIHRVLRDGGYAVISTENLSSWPNIVALTLGQQAFSQSISSRCHIGNIMSLHHSEQPPDHWAHIKIFTYHGLKALFQLYGFQVEALKGAGHYPFPKTISSIVSRLDPVHAHFITIKVRK